MLKFTTTTIHSAYEKNHFFFFLFAIALSSFAYKPKDFDKYIDKLDVWQYVKDTPREHPAYFWSAIVNNDQKSLQFAKDREKGKETALNALRAIAEGQLAASEYIMSLEPVYEANYFVTR